MSDEASDLLNILRHTIWSELRLNKADLTLRQLGIFLIVYRTPEPQTVRGLAKMLSIGKPIVTRSLNRLSDTDLVQRARDPADGRNILVTRTEQGDAMMRRLGEAMAAASLSR